MTLNERQLPGGRDWAYAALLCSTAFAVYMANGDFPYNPDTRSNTRLTLSLLYDGDLHYGPEEVPEFFVWALVDGADRQEVKVEELDDELKEMLRRGELVVVRPDYFAMKSVRPGEYINPWGPGTAIAALPIFFVWDRFVSSFAENPGSLWVVGKFTAALYVAGSVGLIYLTCAMFVRRTHAAIIALSYAFGTCVWSSSSQNLWQHGPMEFFLALGVMLFCRRGRGWLGTAGCSAALSAATLCRPTGAMFVIAVGTHFLFFERRALVPYVLAGLPFGLGLFGYNAYYLGHAATFGQSPTEPQPEVVAVSGSGDMWQTPLWYGALGHAISPSRGLLVFSPFLVFAFWGAYRAWRDPRFRDLRMLSLGVLLVWGVQCRFFDWWGGFSYGYRHLVDTATVFVLFLIPVVERIFQRRLSSAIFAILLSWSVAVQILGVTVYDVVGWNGRDGLLVRGANGEPLQIDLDLDNLAYWREQSDRTAHLEFLSIDDKAFRWRLWSIGDNQIAYYIQNAAKARRNRRRWHALCLADRNVRLAAAHRNIALAWTARGKLDRARNHFSIAERTDPASVTTAVGLQLTQDAGVGQKLYEALALADASRDFAIHNRLGSILYAHPSLAVRQLDRAAQLDPIESLAELRFVDAESPFPAFFPASMRDDLAGQILKEKAIAEAFRMGHLRRQSGRPSEAIRHFEQGIAMDPTMPTGYLHLGEALQQIDRWRESLQPLQKTLDLGAFGRDAAAAHRLRAAAYLRLGMLEDARGELDLALALAPHDGETLKLNTALETRKASAPSPSR